MRSFLVLILSLMSSVAFASNQVMTYQGILTNSSDEPYTTSQTVTFLIYSPAPATCLLYSEEQTIVPDSKGRFTAKIGSGTRNDGLPHPFLKAFMNGGSLTGLSCANGDSSYTPGTADNRVLSIKVNGTPLNPPVEINSVPYAMQAQEVSGWGINNLVKVHPSTGSPTTFTFAEMGKVKLLGAAATCAANEILKWDGSAWICSPDASGGAAPGDASYNSSNKGLVAFDTDAATSGISVASGIAKLSNTAVTAGSYGSATEVSSFTVDAQGRLTAASSIPIALLPSQIAQSGANSGEVLKWNGTAWVPSPDATGGAPSDSSYGAKGVVQFDTDAATSGISIASGVARVNTGTGANQILRLDGSGKLPAVDGSALANLNIGNASTGTLQVNRGGTGVTAFNANALVMTNGTGTALGTITCSPGQILKWNGSSWGCDTDSTGVTNDGSFAVKGLLQGLTDVETSGLNIASGVISVNAGTSANQILKLDGTGKLPAVDGSALLNVSANSFSGVLTVAQGGTNSSTALNDDRIMVSSGGRIVEAAAMTNGQIIVGSTGAAPAVATLGSSNGISITTGAGSLSIGTNATSNNTASTIVSRDGSGNFAASAVTNTSNILKGSTSGTLTMTVPGTVTPYTLTWPSAVGSAGAFLTTDAAGNLSWGSPAAISDATYTAKGAVQFDTDAATSGLNLVSGIASVNTGTGPKQIVQMDASSKLPAVDGSALTNLSANNLSGAVPIAKGGTGQNTAAAAFNALSPLAAKGDLLSKDGANHIVLPLGTNGQVLSVDTAEASGLKWVAPPAGSVTGVTAGTGLLVGTTAGATISTTGTLNINAGTGANQIVQLDGSSKLPPVDGSALTGLSAGNISAGTLPIVRGGTNSGTALTNNKVMVSSGGAIVEGTGFASTNSASTFVTRDASGNFAGGVITNNSNILKGATSGTLTMAVPGTVASYTLTWPGAVGAANTFLKTDSTGGLSWSGIDGSALTGLDAGNISAGVLPIARGGTNNGSLGVTAGGILYMDGSKAMTTSAGTSGQALISAGAGTPAFGTLGVSGGGTGATNLTANGVLIGNGTGAVTSTTGSQYQVLRVATVGSAPTFGSLDLSQAAAVTGTLPVARGGTGIAATGAAGTLLRSTGTSSVPAWTTPTAAGIFEKGGNLFGSAATLGTNDAFDLVLETNGTPRMTIAADGRVAVGAALNSNDDPGDLRMGGELIVDNANGASNLSLWQNQANQPGRGAPTIAFGTSYAYSHPATGNSIGNLTFLDASTNGGVGAMISVVAAATMSPTSSPANIVFSTTPAGTKATAERLIIKSDGVVGIGTAGTAGSLLDLNGAMTLWGMGAPAVSPGNQGRIYFDSTANKFKISQNGSPYIDLVSGGTVTSVTAGTGLMVGTTLGASITSTGTLNINAGTGANQIVKLDGSAKLPMMDGSQLTALNPANLSTAVAVGKGGTGLSAGTSGGIPYFSATNSMASSALLTQNGVVLGGGAGAAPTTTAAGTAHSVLRVPAGGGAPAFGAIDLSQSAAVTGLLPTGSGGTGLSTYLTGDLLYASGTNTIGKLGIGSSGRILTSTGSVPQWTATLPVLNGGTGTTSFTANSLIVANGSGSALSSMVCSADGDVLRWDSFLGVWQCGSGAGGSFATYGAHGLVRIKDDPDTAGLYVNSGVLNVNYGTSANQIIKLDPSARLPAVDGSNLTFSSLKTPALYGGVNPSQNLTLKSTTDPSKGRILVAPDGDNVSIGANVLTGADTFAVSKNNGAPIVTINGYSTVAATAPALIMRRSNTASEGHVATPQGHVLGKMEFHGSTGAANGFRPGAKIEAKQVYANGSFPPTSLYFHTSTEGGMANRMVINYTGNIGIGTNEDPLETYRLDLRADEPNQPSVRVQHTETTGYSNIDFIDDGNINRISIGYGNSNAPNTSLRGAYVGAGASTDLMIRAGDAERIRVLSNGNVGIGMTNPIHKLQVSGTAGLSTGTAWTNTSDIRVKDIDGDYEYGLKEILQLNTVRFHYKKNNPLGLSSENPMTGFIAQEVQKVIPDAVSTRTDGYLELNVDPIHWATVNAVQDLHGMCKAKDEKLNSHQRKIASLEAENQRIKSEMKKQTSLIQIQNQKLNELEQRLKAIESRLSSK